MTLHRFWEQEIKLSLHPNDDDRTRAAITAFWAAVRKQAPWRTAIRKALAAADAVDPMRKEEQ